MLMSILCPLNLSVRFLWCVQFLSIKHRGVKQAAGRLVPLLQAWISPFWFSYLSWMGMGGAGGPGRGPGELFGKGSWEGATQRYEGILGVFVPFTRLAAISQTHTSSREHVNTELTWFSLEKRRIHTFKNKGRMGGHVHIWNTQFSWCIISIWHLKWFFLTVRKPSLDTKHGGFVLTWKRFSNQATVSKIYVV